MKQLRSKKNQKNILLIVQRQVYEASCSSKVQKAINKIKNLVIFLQFFFLPFQKTFQSHKKQLKSHLQNIKSTIILKKIEKCVFSQNFTAIVHFQSILFYHGRLLQSLQSECYIDINSSMALKRSSMKTEELIRKAVESIFKKYDQNHNNYIDLPEFQRIIDDLNLQQAKRLSNRQITKIFQMLDVNGDGMVSRQEFFSAFLSIKGAVQ